MCMRKGNGWLFRWPWRWEGWNSRRRPITCIACFPRCAHWRRCDPSNSTIASGGESRSVGISIRIFPLKCTSNWSKTCRPSAKPPKPRPSYSWPGRASTRSPATATLTTKTSVPPIKTPTKPAPLPKFLSTSSSPSIRRRTACCSRPTGIMASFSNASRKPSDGSARCRGTTRSFGTSSSEQIHCNPSLTPIRSSNPCWPPEHRTRDDEHRSAMVRLSRNPRDLSFPAVEHATPDGLLAIGGDLQPERLLEAYRHGIFPWYNEGQPILWWSPDPRTVLFPEHLHISRSLKRSLRPGHFTVTLDRCFETIVRHCAGPRPQYPEGGTWITPAMMAAYTALHEAGYAHSVETWQNEQLVGGLYGVAIGSAFFAESMFTKVDDASKVALVSLVRQLRTWNFRIIDCQQSSPHVLRLGAEGSTRNVYVEKVAAAVVLPGRPGRWKFDVGSD